MSRGGNLRGAPLFLRPSVVRGLIGDVSTIRKAVTEVPVLPITLVDRPRPSEDPRLAKANDDTTYEHSDPRDFAFPGDVGESGDATKPESELVDRVQDPEPAPIDWPDAPLPEHADPDLDRPEPQPQPQLSRNRKSRATGVRAAQRAAKVERDARLLELYAAGVEVAEIAEQLGVSTHTVREIARDAGLRRTTGKKPSTAIAARNAEIARAYAAGESILILMECHGLSRANVYKIAEKAGVARDRDDTARDRELLDGFASGTPAKDLAARYGLAIGTIYQKASKAGVRAPKRPKREPKPRLPRAPKPKAPKPVHVSVCRGETPPIAVIEAAAAKLPEVAAAPAPRPVPAPAKQPVEGFDTVRHHRIVVAGGIQASKARKARQTDARARRAAEDDEAVAAFELALARVRARKAGQVVSSPAKPTGIDWNRVANAHASKAAKAKTAAARPAPTEPAPSREECPRCGIPGWKGCDHYLPHAEPRVPPPASVRPVGRTMPV